MGVGLGINAMVGVGLGVNAMVGVGLGVSVMVRVGPGSKQWWVWDSGQWMVGVGLWAMWHPFVKFHLLIQLLA